MNQITKNIKIYGRVQGVGFRYFTRKTAERLQVKGWVKNMQDGSVEAVLSGDETSLNKMIEQLQEGPASARVSDITVKQAEPPEGGFSDFTVRR